MHIWALISLSVDETGDKYRHLLGDYIPSTIIAHIIFEYPGYHCTEDKKHCKAGSKIFLVAE